MTLPLRHINDSDVERAAIAILCVDHPEACGWSGKPREIKDRYRAMARVALLAVEPDLLEEACNCVSYCGDDGDIDGPGTCKDLPCEPRNPGIEIVLVRR